MALQRTIEAAQETEFDWPESLQVERIKAGITEVGLGLLLLAALVSLAIVCSDGVGYVYDSVLSMPSR